MHAQSLLPVTQLVCHFLFFFFLSFLFNPLSPIKCYTACIISSFLCMVDAYFIACYSLFDAHACGLLCILSVRVLPCDLSFFIHCYMFTDLRVSGTYGYFNLLLVGLAFSGLHHGLILLFLFLGMCWLCLHVHSDISAVVAMPSRWSARPACIVLSLPYTCVEISLFLKIY